MAKIYYLTQQDEPDPPPVGRGFWTAILITACLLVTCILCANASAETGSQVHLVGTVKAVGMPGPMPEGHIPRVGVLSKPEKLETKPVKKEGNPNA